MTARSRSAMWLWCRWTLARVHPGFWVSAVLAGVALWSWAVWLPLLQEQAQVERGEIEDLRARLARSPVRPVEPLDVGERNWQLWYATLTPARSVEDPVRILWSTAQQAGLEVLRADYRHQCGAVAWLCAYRIEVPINGSYRALRWFAEQSLARLPQLSLDELEFKRDGVSDDELQARMVFTLHLRDTRWPEGRSEPTR